MTAWTDDFRRVHSSSTAPTLLSDGSLCHVEPLKRLSPGVLCKTFSTNTNHFSATVLVLQSVRYKHSASFYFHGKLVKRRLKRTWPLKFFGSVHLTQRQRGSLCQDPAGNRTTRRPPDHRKKNANCSGMVMSPVHHFWPKPSCKAQ